MKHFKVKSLAISGRGKKIYKSGDSVTENDFVNGRAEELVKEGHLVEAEAPNEEKGESSELNATDAIELIETLDTVEAIDLFILGDTRKTVLKSAEDKKSEIAE